MKRQRQEPVFMTCASPVPDERKEQMEQDPTPCITSKETLSAADADANDKRMRLSLQGRRGVMRRQLEHDGYPALNAITQQNLLPQQSQNVVAQETTTTRTVAVSEAATSSLHRFLRSNFKGNGFANPSLVVNFPHPLVPDTPALSPLRTSATTITRSTTVKKPNRLPSTSSGGGPPVQLSSACLLIPVCMAMWWYWTRKACQRVVKGLLRHTPEPTPPTYSASPTSPPTSSNNNQESSPEVGGEYYYAQWYARFVSIRIGFLLGLF
jgi:hypothetical protein